MNRLLGAVHQRLSPLGNVHGRNANPVHRVAARLRRPLDRRYLRHVGAVDDLERLGSSVAAARPSVPARPRVLVLALRAFPSHNAIESVVAHALGMRGGDVALVTCGGGMPICEVGWARRVWPRPCDRCAFHTDAVGSAARLPVYRLAEHLPWGGDGRRAPLEAPPGRLDPRVAAAISLPWFVRTPDVERAPDGPAARRDYAVSAAGVERAADAILSDFAPDIVLMVNGLFAAEHVFRARALERGARVVTYEMTPRAGALWWSQDEPAPRYDLDTVWETLRSRPLTAEQDAALGGLLRDRETGAGAHERYFDSPTRDLEALRARLGVSPGRRVVSLFTNVVWDSAAIGADLHFASMYDWVEAAVRAVAPHEDAVLVIRVHPAEAKYGSFEGTADALTARFPELPSNVRLVRADEPVDSYGVLDMSDRVLTYASTTGLEAATRGLPVSVAARCHYRGRGFTWDVEALDDLEAFVAASELTVDEERHALARRYAFTFFFRAMIPFPVAPVRGGRAGAQPTRAAAVAPGADPFLDLVCDRILDGAPFVLPDELALDGAAAPDAAGVRVGSAG